MAKGDLLVNERMLNNYARNTFDKIQASLSSNVETSTTASKAYAVGDTLILNGVLYDVTASISQGGTITAGTNVVASNFDSKVKGSLGTKLSATVSGTALTFTDASILSTSVIDGPYIADVLIGINEVSTGTNTITYTLEDDSASGKTAYIWVRG